MPTYNSTKTVLFSSFIAMVSILYSIKFDFVDLKIPYSPFIVLFKIFFAVLPFTIFYFFKKINIDKKVFFCSFIWSSYCILSTYFFALNYWIIAVQIAIIYTCVFFIDRIQFLITFSFLTIGTSFAILFSKSPYGFGALNSQLRAILFDDYINLQLITVAIYFVVSYPRIKKLKEDLKFSNFGKASSFILHEMQKPLSRINAEGVFKDEIESLKKTLSMAKQLQSGSLDTVKIENVDIEKLCLETIEKYEEFITYFKIQVSYNIPVKILPSDQVMLGFMLDNFVRNAIEANKENRLENRWISFNSLNNHLKISNPYITMIAESDLFTPLRSSKEGNMGTGLHFCKTISEGLNHKIKAKCDDNIFEIKIEF